MTQNSDIRSDLTPRDDTLHLIGSLGALKSEILGVAHQWQLLDDAGHVPAEPFFAELLQHAAGAQNLSRNVVQQTADFARSPHSTNRAGSAVLAHLAMAVTLSSNAVPNFAETAEIALALPRSTSPTDREHRAHRMVICHATARAYLRRTSESLQDAVTELDSHLDLHRFFTTASPQQKPVPAPPGPAPRHR
ncbi:hypothetical protein V2S66_18795 [Streptomyces sp. V4-01]|uniref:DUF222 domain-containing protein n=1 Tax=Actinacidiphila polyblastidii TaxID=3110430 RepID=A0ABU7PDX2_9ACTN|nr:hypothetical protein [Streptomyces sp. V4-01]